MARSNFLSTPYGVLLILLFLPFLSNAGVIVLNGLTHPHDVVPGETYRGKIEIQNTSDKDQPVKLYQRDYSFNFKDEAFYEEPGTSRRSNATWMDISPSYLVLKPKEKTMISYEIKVPDNSSLYGTYWSVIMIEGEVPVDVDQLKNGLTINTQIRYAIQVVTTFNNTGERNLTFFDVNLKKGPNQQKLDVDIENKGDFMFKPDVSVELFDEKGESVGVFTAMKKKIYPNTSARFEIELEGIGAGTYQALLLADCGEEDVFGMNLDLEITND